MAGIKARSASRRADAVLALVFILFAAAAVFRHLEPEDFWARLCFAITEAALVGGVADWFAVTALFRKPLGFPWHTALIPRSRDRLIGAVVSAVREDLLSREAIKNRMADIDLVGTLVGWVERHGGQERIAGWAAGLAESGWRSLDRRALARLGQRLVRRGLKEDALRGVLTGGVQRALSGSRADALADTLLRWLLEMAQRTETREMIRHQLSEYRQSEGRSWWKRLALDLAEAVDMLNLDEAAEAVQEEWTTLLRRLLHRDDSLRIELKTRMEAAAAALAEPSRRDALIQWLKDGIERAELEDVLVEFLTGLAEQLPPEAVGVWIGEQFGRFWTRLTSSGSLRDWLEKQLKAAASQLVDQEQGLIALVVYDALNRLEDEELNLLVEELAGEDLAWIRINGSVVGALVGLVLFLGVEFWYGAHVSPWIRNWLT